MEASRDDIEPAAPPTDLDLSAEFERWAPAALQKVVDLMHHARHERTQLQAAQVILEYTARKPSAGLDVRLMHDFGRTVNAALERRRTLLLRAGSHPDSVECENCGTAEVVPERAPGALAAADVCEPSTSRNAQNPQNEALCIAATPQSVRRTQSR